MPLFDTERHGRAASYALSSTTAVAALAELRQQTFPQLVSPPQFIPRTRPPADKPQWLSRVFERLTRQVVVAGLIAAAVLVLAAALPAWAAIQQGGSTVAPSPSREGRSSVGITGSPATRVEDLGVSTFVGRIAFVRQFRYFNALTGGPQAQRFVEGARQASIAEYLQNVGIQVTLPYLRDAASTKAAVDAWAAAERAELERQAALRLATSRAVWQAPALAGGTRIPGASVTFYSCIDNGFCGLMASGGQVFAGAAACSTNLPFGTRFVINSDPTGRVFVCLDRGALSPTWVDIWFYDAADGWAWQSIVGTRSDITIVE